MRLRRAAALALAAPLLLAAAWVAAPLPPGLLDRAPVTSLRVEDRTGGVLHELRSRADGRAVPLPGAVPSLVRSAFLAAEDHRFGLHPGVDPLAVARAAGQDLRSHRVVSGASTLAMQLARMLVPRPRTLAGKLGEALWALRLTAHLGRERVLREYLDRVALGNSLYGVEAAAQAYFGRPAATLSLGQAALLAGLARGPERADPWRRPEAARRRLGRVLDRMRALGLISEEERRVAAEAPLDLVSPARELAAPHLVLSLAARLGELGLDRAASLRTTLDPSLQADVEAIVRDELASLRERNVNQAAALVLDNATGEVLAYVGSRDYWDEASLGRNDGVRARRQPGSALKPFAYGLALASGHTPAEVLSDVETHLATPSGDYAPRNYDRRVHGPVRLRAALANSYNVPAVRLAESLGPARVLGVLRQAGFDSLSEDASHYGAGIVLGDGEVTLRELARAYLGLARGGVVQPLVEVAAARDPEGQALPIPRELEPRRFLPEDAAALLTDILADAAARAPAFGLDNALRLPFPVAAKTGTSRAYVDNWTAGFTRERTVAVWVGNFDGQAMRRVSGITGAAPIFRRVMLRAMRGLRPAPLVDRARFTRADVCPLSGALAGPACPGALHEVFLPGSEPRQPCAMHQLDPATGRARLDVGAEFYAWARGEGLDEARGSLEVRPSRAGVPQSQLLLPGDGDEYLLDPGVPGESQAIPVRVRAGEGVRELELRTEAGQVIPLGPGLTAHLPAERGQHRVELWQRGGARAEAAASYRVR